MTFPLFVMINQSKIICIVPFLLERLNMKKIALHLKQSWEKSNSINLELKKIEQT